MQSYINFNNKEYLLNYWYKIGEDIIKRQNNNIKLDDFIFKMSYTGESTLMSDSFGIMTEYLFGKKLNKSQIIKYKEYITKFQDKKTGLFICKKLDNNAKDVEYIKRQTTYFTLKAMLLYDLKPKYKLNFLEPFKDLSYTINWLEKLDWNDSWLVSNNVMFLIFFLGNFGKQLNISNEILEGVFDWLDNFQDPVTGFFGNNCSSYLLGSMCGSFHIYPSYMFHGKKINYIEKIIDNTISLQNSDGCFYPVKGGGACPDYDGVDILSKFYLLTSYRKNDIELALNKALDFLISNQLDSGAFCEAKRDPSELSNIEKFPKLLQPWLNTKEFKYSGYAPMKYNIENGDVWSNLIRSYTISLIMSSIYGLDIFGYDNKPTHLWHDKNKIINKNFKLYN